ncbi:hypothetical protein [Thermococcus thioreducens]|uniref:Uncharacterized protein n=1 Tax=Thermococcus thioreducens TaxID=277988 RepID=A0A0Q2UPE3_9EURY|nr:hypothetical protein [Thermococcus thioreducens]ASJ11700.1 hypothetical protein A3L14_01815 [Thermococcus thioreducens]KQH82568.1 hypothetical protein AMR53_04625 [Thermococcus thioreducens]SEW15361.1 hypothetical protein SAMN05216170_1919 [Thermococcus thioreducens]
MGHKGLITVLKILAYGWMFYIPQIVALSVLGKLAGYSGLLAIFIAASVGYTLRALLMMAISVGLMSIIFWKKPSIEFFKYFLPLSCWGILSLLLRFANLIVPQILQVRILIEQISLVMAWFVSYYRLGTLFRTDKNTTMWPIVGALLIGILVFLLLPPPI